ncbi:MAG: hypothetical protein OXC42_01775 [Gammaproteobacteria bacterium]|nr:hypothetical protein [Gammaproteobacteria bacterium]
MRLLGLDSSEIDQTFLSVGSHRKQRPLTPVEVAWNIHKAEKAGASKTEIAKAFGFNDATMVSRFLQLLKLSEEIQYLVEWRESTSSSIGFSVAVELAKMPQSNHPKMISAIIENHLTKKEVVSMRQLRERSNRSLSDCIKDVVQRRVRTQVRHVVLGKLTEEELNRNSISKNLKRMRQSERDQLIKKIVKDLYPNLGEFSAKLGEKNFAVIGSKHVGAVVASDLEFEERVSRLLTMKITDNG